MQPSCEPIPAPRRFSGSLTYLRHPTGEEFMAATESDRREPEPPPSAAPAGEGGPDWHAIPAEDALGRLDADAEGLREDEAVRRRDRYGPNSLTPAEKRSPWRRFARQFANALIRSEEHTSELPSLMRPSYA